jgi:hypothetical protein
MSWSVALQSRQHLAKKMAISALAPTSKGQIPRYQDARMDLTGRVAVGVYTNRSEIVKIEWFSESFTT